MAYWLVKSEPAAYSWEQFLKDKTVVWEGVRNYAARLHLIGMKKGDRVLFYHSTGGTEIAGIATVTKQAYQDPGTTDERWVAVDLKPLRSLKNRVSLSQIKAEKKLANMALVRISRLSVQPVAEQEWDLIMKMAGE